jgi:hypothetical protein
MLVRGRVAFLPDARRGTVARRTALAAVNPNQGSTAMRGLITGREVVRHAFTIIRLFGLPTYFRCLRGAVSRKPTTFLALVMAGGLSHG